MNQFSHSLREQMKRTGESERRLSELVKVSRGALRNYLAGEYSALAPVLRVLNHYKQNAQLVTFPKDQTPVSSTVAISYKMLRDGFDSWKIHLMDMVDEFRVGLDMRLILLPPPSELPIRLQALIAATVIELCKEIESSPPDWASNFPSLQEPWFVSDIQSLMASALLESPPGFRSKNIFVLENFLQRA